MDNLKQRIDIAAGRKQASLVIRNGVVVDLFGHGLVHGSVAIEGGTIIGIGDYRGLHEIDAAGRYILPGFIDSHVHIESSLSTPAQFASAVLPRGTTTVIADPHEIANVCGLDGIRYMLKASRNLPVDIYFMLPSCVPATGFEHSGAVLGAEELERLIDEERVLGLGELMDYPSLIAGSEPVLKKVMLAKSRHKFVDGHSPMVSGNDLTAYAVAGVRTDHECSTVQEMNDRLSRGMYVLLREGSAARNMEALIKGVTPENSRRCLFCTDDRQPEDILATGHIDNHLRIAVRNGIDPITAVTMASLNAAECYRLDGKGAVAPGYDADLVFVEDLKDFAVSTVLVGGNVVAKDGRSLFELPKEIDASSVTDTVHVKPFGVDAFRLKLDSSRARVIQVAEASLITEAVEREVERDDAGCFRPLPGGNIVKLAVIERHNATGNIGLALLENYGIKGGAVASTIAHDSHNIIVAGDRDEDMYTAVRELVSVGGGITIVAGGNVMGTLELPIAGLMSDRSAAEIDAQLSRMLDVARNTLGINPGLDPFMTLSFLALPVIPKLKLTDMGLFDVEHFTFTGNSVP
ncbi:adenine deaminase [Sediminispirochaeta bajacaliforniensis]|uniref:adenine deaminase n=1 Tax=Sediminispirochaeta bajacaliforniensis TaxID=148 RepID=UPI00036E28AE|nr:adenine deaminase [Sediminispirochaeta bajacaliforniensis]